SLRNRRWTSCTFSPTSGSRLKHPTIGKPFRAESAVVRLPAREWRSQADASLRSGSADGDRLERAVLDLEFAILAEHLAGIVELDAGSALVVDLAAILQDLQSLGQFAGKDDLARLVRHLEDLRLDRGAIGRAGRLDGQGDERRSIVGIGVERTRATALDSGLGRHGMKLVEPFTLAARGRAERAFERLADRIDQRLADHAVGEN